MIWTFFAATTAPSATTSRVPLKTWSFSLQGMPVKLHFKLEDVFLVAAQRAVAGRPA